MFVSEALMHEPRIVHTESVCLQHAATSSCHQWPGHGVRCAVLCFAMPCCAMPCCAALCRVALGCAVLLDSVLQILAVNSTAGCSCCHTPVLLVSS